MFVLGERKHLEVGYSCEAGACLCTFQVVQGKVVFRNLFRAWQETTLITINFTELYNF